MKNYLQDFLENEPPYKVIDITVDQLQQMQNIEKLTITHYCEKCKQRRTFKCVKTDFKDIKNQFGLYSLAGEGKINFEKFCKCYRQVFMLKFNCQHDCNEEHNIPIMINGLTIQKIGQYPTFAKEEVNKKIIKYKSLIPKFYPELTKAISAYSQNMGVPSFVYLRRILEHLVDTKAKLYNIVTEQKFIDKLHEVEKHEKIIPDEFDEIKNQLYTVLSKGVHEYEENECIEIFAPVKFIIECILDTELMKKEREQKAKEAKAIIQQKLKKDCEE